MFFTFLEWQLLCCTILNKPDPCMFVVEHQCHHAQLHRFLIFVLLHSWDRNRLQSHIFLIVRLLSRIRGRKHSSQGFTIHCVVCVFRQNIQHRCLGPKILSVLYKCWIGGKDIYMFSDILLHDIDDNHDDNDQSLWTQPLLVDHPTDWENVWPPD